LETGHVAMRKRGARTDDDCINEICELVAQGITATASVRYVGVPYTTWYAWLRKNHERARDKYNLAYEFHLEAMADKPLRILLQLKAEREAALKVYYAAQDKWQEECKVSPKGDRLPPEPRYRGPAEWELKAAVEQLKAWQWHLTSRHEKFKQVIEQRGGVTISHELNLKRDPREAMREYLKLIDVRSDE
jgi:hypothetical protein